jgi:hypothetical protein
MRTKNEFIDDDLNDDVNVDNLLLKNHMKDNDDKDSKDDYKESNNDIYSLNNDFLSELFLF